MPDPASVAHFGLPCPACGTPYAYVGLVSVKCVNEHCIHFNPEYCGELESDTDMSLEFDDTDPGWVVNFLDIEE